MSFIFETDTPVKIGHKHQTYTKESRLQGYLHLFDDFSMIFNTESSNVTVVIEILDQNNTVLGETYVFPHGIIERDSYGPMINDNMTEGRASFELYHLVHSKVRHQTDNPLDDPKLWNKAPSKHATMDKNGAYK